MLAPDVNFVEPAKSGPGSEQELAVLNVDVTQTPPVQIGGQQRRRGGALEKVDHRFFRPVMPGGVAVVSQPAHQVAQQLRIEQQPRAGCNRQPKKMNFPGAEMNSPGAMQLECLIRELPIADICVQ